jgi:hypothetical protein
VNGDEVVRSRLQSRSTRMRADFSPDELPSTVSLDSSAEDEEVN